MDGNDYDKDFRVIEAFNIREQNTGKPRGVTLLDIINRSLAFRIISGVEDKIVGVTLQIDIPYIENKSNVELDDYVKHVQRILQTNGISNVRQVVIRSHLNPDPDLRKENRNEWYKNVYELVKSYMPQAEVLHIFGHSHKTPPPYVFKDTGVLLVPIGYGAKEGIQRVVTLDYQDPTKRYYVDLAINRQQRIDIATKGSF